MGVPTSRESTIGTYNGVQHGLARQARARLPIPQTFVLGDCGCFATSSGERLSNVRLVERVEIIEQVSPLGMVQTSLTV